MPLKDAAEPCDRPYRPRVLQRVGFRVGAGVRVAGCGLAVSGPTFKIEIDQRVLHEFVSKVVLHAERGTRLTKKCCTILFTRWRCI